MHFFSPTFIMRLVECVRGSATSPHAIATIAAVSKAMRKVWTHTSATSTLVR
jgi:3-hydroxyacyl-CoA dehydrogenase